MFYVDKSGGVSLLDTEFKPQIEAAINDKKADEENLKTMYSHIPVPESM